MRNNSTLLKIGKKENFQYLYCTVYRNHWRKKSMQKLFIVLKIRGIAEKSLRQIRENFLHWSFFCIVRSSFAKSLRLQEYLPILVVPGPDKYRIGLLLFIGTFYGPGSDFLKISSSEQYMFLLLNLFPFYFFFIIAFFNVTKRKRENCSGRNGSKRSGSDQN